MQNTSNSVKQGRTAPHSFLDRIFNHYLLFLFLSSTQKAASLTADCSLFILIDTGKSFPADTPVPQSSLTADAVTVPLSESLPHTFPGTPAASFPDTTGLPHVSEYAATSCDMQTERQTNRLPKASPESPATQSAIRFLSSGTAT